MECPSCGHPVESIAYRFENDSVFQYQPVDCWRTYAHIQMRQAREVAAERRRSNRKTKRQVAQEVP